MKIFILIIFLILFNKYAYSNNLFDTTFYDIEFTSKNIEDDKIQAINEMKETSDYDTKLEEHFSEIFDDYTLIKSKIFAKFLALILFLAFELLEIG